MIDKLVIKLVIFFNIIIFIIGNCALNSCTYTKITNNLFDISEVGVKYVGNYNCSIKDIIDTFNENSNVKKVENKENNIAILGNLNNINYEASIGKEDSKEVVIVLEKITNKEEAATIKKQLEKLTNDTCKNPRYFTYVKGKIKKKKEEAIKILTDSLIEYGANNIKTISINSGYAGIADIQSFHINYAVCSYGFDTYMILGVPDIFITY